MYEPTAVPCAAPDTIVIQVPVAFTLNDVLHGGFSFARFQWPEMKASLLKNVEACLSDLIDEEVNKRLTEEQRGWLVGCASAGQ